MGGGTSQALQVSNNYRELEKKYGALTSMMSSQNQFIARLEKQCQCKDSTQQSSLVGNKNCGLHITILWCTWTEERNWEGCAVFVCWSTQVMTEPAKSHSGLHRNYSSEADQMTNDVQRDQSASPHQQEKAGGVHSLPATTANTPTEPPFISFPVTKTPGTSVPHMSFNSDACVYMCANLLSGLFNSLDKQQKLRESVTWWWELCLSGNA